MGRYEELAPRAERTIDGGTYVLVLWLEQDRSMTIGRLGEVCFKRGLYFYVGSALQGIERRMRRHLGKGKSSHWHIDYLTKCATVLGAVYILTREKDAECRVASSLCRRFNSIPGFGSSDCRCGSHLFWFAIEG